MSSEAGGNAEGSSDRAGATNSTASETSISHSREKIGLCSEIILDHFGPIAAQVASTLLQRGRLTLRELSRFLAIPTFNAPTAFVAEQDDSMQNGEANILDSWQSGMPNGIVGPNPSSSNSSVNSRSTPLRSQKLIQQALITLIQHNICWHARTMPNGSLVQVSPESTSSDEILRGNEYFQINVEEVLPRLRYGAYLNIAEDKFGEIGLSITNEVLRNGKIRVSHLIKQISLQGHEEELVENTVKDLLYYGYVQPSLPKLHTSARDRRISYEAEAVSQSKKILGSKDKKNIAIDARAMLYDDDHAIWFTSNRGDKPVRRGLSRRKRPLTTNGKGTKNGKSSKKHKLSNGKSSKRNGLGIELSEEEEDVDEETGAQLFSIDPQLFIRVNYDRFDVHIRDEGILRTVEAKYNTQLANVVKVMLRLCTGGFDSIPSARDLYSSSLHVNTIRQKIPLKIGLKDAFDQKSIREKFGPDAYNDNTLVGEAIAVLLGGGDESSSGRRKRFIGPSSLAKPNKHFGGYTQIQIEYRNTARTMKYAVLRTMIEAQFGTSGTRVMTLLQDLGKLDEKQISKVCLMSMSETRDVCARLFAAGLLSLQEVPKASERIAARTFFFWYVDEKKCFSWLSDHLCKSLARLAQRRRYEQSREMDLLIKSQRDDESTLRDIERLRLQRVRETVETISLAEVRTWQDLFIVASLPE